MLQSSMRVRINRLRRATVFGFAGLAGVALAMVAGMASASSFTLRVEKNVHVTNAPTMAFAVRPVDTHEAVAVGPSGYAVYTFQGETTHHLICHKTHSAKTDCWAFWPPVSVHSAKGLTKQAGIKGKLGAFHNHGKLQLTLNGQPLYYFAPDLQAKDKSQATGDELKTFGSTWHIVAAGSPAGGATPTGTRSTMPAPTTGSTTTPAPPYWG